MSDVCQLNGIAARPIRHSNKCCRVEARSLSALARAYLSTSVTISARFMLSTQADSTDSRSLRHRLGQQIALGEVLAHHPNRQAAIRAVQRTLTQSEPVVIQGLLSVTEHENPSNVLASSSQPSWRRAISLAIASPSPWPSSVRVRASLARKNGRRR